MRDTTAASASNYCPRCGKPPYAIGPSTTVPNVCTCPPVQSGGVIDSRGVGRWPSDQPTQTDLILKYLSEIIELLEEIRDQGKGRLVQ